MANFGQIRSAIFSDCFLAYFLPFRFLAQNDSMVKSLKYSDDSENIFWSVALLHSVADYQILSHDKKNIFRRLKQNSVLSFSSGRTQVGRGWVGVAGLLQLRPVPRARSELAHLPSVKY